MIIDALLSGRFLVVFMITLLWLSVISFCGYCLLEVHDAVRFALLVVSSSVILTRLMRGSLWARGVVGILGWFNWYMSALAIWYLVCEDEYSLSAFIDIIGRFALLLGSSILYIPNVRTELDERRMEPSILGWVACPLTFGGLLCASGFWRFDFAMPIDSMPKLWCTIIVSVIFTLIVLRILNRIEKI